MLHSVVTLTPPSPAQALEMLQLRPGQRVLIHAGAGGVGSVAVPLAKAQGLHVTTTCSTRNLAFVKQARHPWLFCSGLLLV